MSARVIIIGEPGAIPVPDRAIVLDTDDVPAADLLANAIRMRPDVIVIGGYWCEHVCGAGLWRVGRVAVTDDCSGYSISTLAWTPSAGLQATLAGLYRAVIA